ncbi:GspH/FimT family pseudopilin [Shewanella sp. A14]
MKKVPAGFTLIEIMVTVVIAAILITVAAPSLNSLYENARVKNNIEKIHDIFVFARNQAINYGMTVYVCSFSTTTSCGTTTDWSNGVRVFVEDINGAKTELRAIDNFNDSDKVKGPSKIVTFTADGLSSGGDIIYCPSGKADLSNSISISNSGRVSYGDKGNSC